MNTVMASHKAIRLAVNYFDPVDSANAWNRVWKPSLVIRAVKQLPSRQKPKRVFGFERWVEIVADKLKFFSGFWCVHAGILGGLHCE